jgi:hypothetical protein
LTILENLSRGGGRISSDFVIAEIKVINLLLGTDEFYILYNKKEVFSIPYEKNEKLIQYYRRVDYNNILDAFGERIQIYQMILIML